MVKKLGLECIGCLDSSLEGQKEIYTKKPYFQGKVVWNGKGKNFKRTFQLYKGLASDIIQKSKYTEKIETSNKDYEGTMIDDTELGFELGYGKKFLLEDGIPIKKVRWQEKAIPQIYQTIQEKVSVDSPIRN